MKNDNSNIAINKIKEVDIVFKSILVGLAAGSVSIVYRIALSYAEKSSSYIYSFFSNNLIFLPIMFLFLIIMGYFVGYLVESDDMVSGSGVPQLKQILKKYFYFRMPWFFTLIKKFIGGVIAIFAGLSLGRGGPSIHLGACVAEGLGNKIGKNSMQRKILVASGASAGLAATFNVPIAAVIFILEEIFEDFSLAILLSTIIGAGIADFISKKIFGLTPIFNFPINYTIPFDNRYIMLIVLGLVVGILGVFFNLTLVKMQTFYKKLNFLNKRTKIILPFIITGIIGLMYPIVIGSGNRIIEYLNIESAINFLLIVLLVKFILSIICLGSETPGGIFFPTFVIGALIGCIFAYMMIKYGLYSELFFYNFVILAMAGYLTSVFRTPITGIVLIMELTHSFEHWPSVIIVCIVAHIFSQYIYDSSLYEKIIAD